MHSLNVHPGKLTCPLERDYFSREYILQPLIFSGHVSFQGSNTLLLKMDGWKMLEGDSICVWGYFAIFRVELLVLEGGSYQICRDIEKAERVYKVFDSQTLLFSGF